MALEVLLDRYIPEALRSQRSGKRSLIAQDRQSGQAVFIREYDLSKALNFDRLERFKRQAELLKQMSHPRIPALLDWIQTSDRLLLVSQYVPGQTLASRLQAGWQPQEKDALAIAEQLLQILGYLQEYHRPLLSFDLSPEKLLVDNLNRVWLADFGGLQVRNELQELGASLIKMLTGRELNQLPRIKDKPAFQAFVSISKEFTHWIEQLLDAAPRQSAAQALESLWKLQGKTWQTPLAEQQQQDILRHRSLKPSPSHAQPQTTVYESQEGPWALNSLIDDTYRLRRVLGKGQGGWKYAAYDAKLKQDVMLKLMPLPAEQGVQALELARSLQGLHHPQIPRFLRAFVTEQAGQPFLALAYGLIGGETLKDKFEAGWRPAAAELWDLARQLLKVLSAVQERDPKRGHGNLNPSNLLVNKFGRVWLIDFGLVPTDPVRDLYDLAASLIFLLSGAQPGEFLSGGLNLRFADSKPVPLPLQAWLKRMLQAEPGQIFNSAPEALAHFEQALLAAQPPKLVLADKLADKPLEKSPVKTPVKAADKTLVKAPSPLIIAGSRRARSAQTALNWETGAEQLQALGLQTKPLKGGGLELQCPESKELSQWNRSKTIGMLTSPLRMFEELQEKSRQKSRFFPLSGHRLEISPEDIRLLKGGSSGEHEILAMFWSQLLQANLTPAPPKLLEALKNKVMPPAGTNFRLFHLQLSNQAQNSHCLMYLPPKAIPPLTQLIRQQLVGSF